MPFIAIIVTIISRHYQLRNKLKLFRIILFWFLDFVTLIMFWILWKTPLGILFIAVIYLYINGYLLSKEKSVISLLLLILDVIIIYVIFSVFALGLWVPR